MTRADVTTVAEVNAKAHWEAYAPLFGARARTLDLEAVRDRWIKALDDDDLAFVAVDNGDIIGVALAHRDHVDAIYLRAPYHRQGVGRRLVHHVLRAMRDQGHQEAKFEVLAINVGAVAFYKSLGAKVVGQGAASDSDNDVFFRIETLC